MIEILKFKARQGDLAAVKLIFQYCIGKPAPVNDPDRMDIDEWQRLQQMSVPNEQYEKTEESIPACLACHTAQHDWPCTVQEGDGPLPHAIHHIHEELQPPAASGKRGKSSPDSAQPSAPAARQTSEPNTSGETPVAKPERPSAAKEEQKPRERREQAGGSRSEGRSRTQAPSPNGENDEEQLRTIELLQRAFQPPLPSEQTDHKPPRR